MKLFDKILRKFPYKRKQLDIYVSEFNRIGKKCNIAIDEHNIEEAKFYHGMQVGMVYGAYISGLLNKAEFDNFILITLIDRGIDDIE